jgi:hypothetical protein
MKITVADDNGLVLGDIPLELNHKGNRIMECSIGSLMNDINELLIIHNYRLKTEPNLKYGVDDKLEANN